MKLVHLPMMDHFLINFHHNRLSCSSSSYYSKKEQNGSSFQLQSDLPEIFIAFHKFTERNDFFFLSFFLLENCNESYFLYFKKDRKFQPIVRISTIVISCNELKLRSID